MTYLYKSPYYNPNTYKRIVICEYCGSSNTAKECAMRNSFSWNNCKKNTLEWHIWCSVCKRQIVLTERIYGIVQERLLKNKDTFVFWHDCDKTKMETNIFNTHNCDEHKTCRMYDKCTKCTNVDHIYNKIPSSVLQRLKENDLDETESLETDSLV